MANAWGPGPVFVYETIMETRRWQVYATRAAFVLLILAGMGLVWLQYSRTGKVMTLRDLAQVSEGVFYTLAIVQVSLVLLAAPAVAAGSICGDRARGTLAHMLVTDLSDREIVLGKLGARLAPVFSVLLAAVPVSALGGLLGGLNYEALLALFLETAAMAVFGISLTMAASVRAERPREVLMLVYAVELVWLLALPVCLTGLQIYNTRGGNLLPTFVKTPLWFEMANPFVVALTPYLRPAQWSWGSVAGFCLSLLLLSVILIGWTVRGLRRSALGSGFRKAERSRRRSLVAILFPSLKGPSLDDGPVLWREWHRNRPSRWERWLWTGLAVGSWGLILASIGLTVATGEEAAQQLSGMGLVLHIGFGFLMISVAASSALAEERVRGSLDVLLATPLSSRSILAAKWWGLYRRVATLVVLPVLTVVFFAATTPDLPVVPTGVLMRPSDPVTLADRFLCVGMTGADFLASGALVVSVGLALATWIPRLGRAIGVGVTLYFLVGIVWIVVAEIVPRMVVSKMAFSSATDIYNWVERPIRWLTSLSPIAGPFAGLGILSTWHIRDRMYDWVALTLIVCLKAGVAWGLFALTVRTFDRCLGRMPEQTLRDESRHSEIPAPGSRDRPILAPGRESIVDQEMSLS